MSIHSTSQQKPDNREQKRHFWKTHIQEQERSGMAQRIYCQCHGLSYANFTRWRGLILKDRAKHQTGAGNQLVPLHIPSVSSTGTVTHDHAVDLVLRDGTRIEGITENSLSVATALISRL